ncbi:MAG TPA: hypothetical protein VID27_02415 [Blastocatellia bacterium]|jgi:hypothetical protein
MKNKRKIIFRIVLAATALLLLLALWVRPAVLLRLKDPSAVDPADGLYVVFNPLRNREPEHCAAHFLGLLRDGKCEHSIGSLRDSSRRLETLCREENEHKLVRWELADRKDESEKIELHFRVFRVGYRENTWGNVWVTVERNEQGWQVGDYQAWY